MKKILTIVYLLIFCFSFAQKSDIGRTYHFDLSFKIESKSINNNRTENKLINTKDDTYYGINYDKSFSIFDIKNKRVHSFKKSNDTLKTEFQYYESTKKSKFPFGEDSDIRVKKLSDSQYLITKYMKTNSIKIVDIIINIEKSNFDAANSLDFMEMTNIGSRHLKILRRKEKNQPFIIRSYQATYSNLNLKNNKILDEKKIDVAVSIPKNLIEHNEKTPINLP